MQDIKIKLAELSDMIEELIEANARLETANAILKTGNMGFTNTLRFYEATTHEQAVQIECLKKTINELRGISKWTEVEV
jgi:hypothetical protein